MTQNDPLRRRVWPWVLAVLAGLLTAAGGGAAYETLGSLAVIGAAVMTVKAVRHNRAVRRARLAEAAKPGKKQSTGGQARRPGSGRRAARKAITLIR